MGDELLLFHALNHFSGLVGRCHDHLHFWLWGVIHAVVLPRK
jgi:hypothetical protein